MQTERSIYLRCTLTIIILIGGLYDLPRIMVGGTSKELHAEQVLTAELEIHTTVAPKQVAVIPPAGQSSDLNPTQNSSVDKDSISDSDYVPAGYKLVWNEEFDGTALDLTRWDYRSVGQSSDGSGASVLSRDCVALNGRGQLAITTKEKNGLLQTGMISTTGKFEPLYGYFEARIRFQRQEGHHGAFWLKSTAYKNFPGDPLRAGNEVDIAEFFGSRRSDKGLGINVYWNGKQGETVRRTLVEADLTPILGSESEEFCDRYHVYSLIWTPTEYVFLIDGHKMFTTEDGMSHRGQPVILSLLSHKWEADKLDRNKLDDSMLVDYVRVYQKPPEKLSDHGRSSR